MAWFWPAVGAAIGAAGSLLGGAMSTRAQAREAAADRQLQVDAARHGISWRVQDAKEAGVHPVYALGAQPINVSPVGADVGAAGRGVAEAGQSIGRAFQSLQTQSQRELHSANVRLLTSQADANDAQAAYYRSQAVSPRGPQLPAPAPSWGDTDVIGGAAPYRQVLDPPVVQVLPGAEYEVPGARDVVQAQASQQMSARSGQEYVAAGLAPGSKEYRLTRDLAVLLPASQDLGEALEPISESLSLMWMWYQINVRHYGPAFTDLAFQELGLPVSVLRGFRRARRAVEPFDFSSGFRPGVRGRAEGFPEGAAAFGRYPSSGRR